MEWAHRPGQARAPRGCDAENGASTVVAILKKLSRTRGTPLGPRVTHTVERGESP